MVYTITRAHGLHFLGKEDLADAMEGNQCDGPTDSTAGRLDEWELHWPAPFKLIHCLRERVTFFVPTAKVFLYPAPTPSPAFSAADLLPPIGGAVSSPGT